MGYKINRMRKMQGGLLIIVMVLLASFVSAQTDQDPKILPDSPLWFFKMASEDLRLFATFNQESKLKLRLNYMDERIKEISLSQSSSALEKAKNNYLKHYNKIKGLTDEQLTIVNNALSKHTVVLNQVKAKLESKGISTQGIDNAILMSSKKMVSEKVSKLKNGGAYAIVEEGL